MRSWTPFARHPAAAMHSVWRVGWPVRSALGAHLRARHLRCSSRADCRQLSKELKFKRRNCVHQKVQHRIWLESPVQVPNLNFVFVILLSKEGIQSLETNTLYVINNKAMITLSKQMSRKLHSRFERHCRLHRMG